MQFGEDTTGGKYIKLSYGTTEVHTQDVKVPYRPDERYDTMYTPPKAPPSAPKSVLDPSTSYVMDPVTIKGNNAIVVLVFLAAVAGTWMYLKRG